MSYDLVMLEPAPGEDPMDTLDRLVESEEATAPVANVASRNRQIADALMATNPGYTEFEIKHEVIAAQLGISVDEARAKHRDIELTDEAGLQITLSDHHASINFPYWESLDPKWLVDQIAKASRVISGATGWKLYDPQLEEFIDPVADADEFAEAFGVGVGRVKRVAAKDEARSASADHPSLLRRIFGRR